MDVSLWFPHHVSGRPVKDPSHKRMSPQERLARAICDQCPVKDECLTMHMDEPFGIFGGLDELERRIMSGKQVRPYKERTYPQRVRSGHGKP